MLLFPLWLLACRPAVDAPDDVEEQALFGFVHFDEPGFVEAVADDLLAFVHDPPAELEEGFVVDSLRADDLAAVGVFDPVADSSLVTMTPDLATQGVCLA
jgi:hypothetical protein